MRPARGITTDPVTGRRYVLEYVELGTRVVLSLDRENDGVLGDDFKPRNRKNTARRDIRRRFSKAHDRAGMGATA